MSTQVLSAPISSLSLLLVQTQAERCKAVTTEQLASAHLYLDIAKSGYLFQGFSGGMKLPPTPSSIGPPLNCSSDSFQSFQNLIDWWVMARPWNWVTFQGQMLKMACLKIHGSKCQGGSGGIFLTLCVQFCLVLYIYIYILGIDISTIPRWNQEVISDDMFKSIFLYGQFRILDKISLKYVP